MTALNNLNLFYHLAGFIDGNKYSVFELVDIAIYNYKKPLSNYSIYLVDAQEIYKREVYNDFYATETAKTLIKCMKYKDFDIKPVIYYIYERYEGISQWPYKPKINKTDLFKALNI